MNQVTAIPKKRRDSGQPVQTSEFLHVIVQANADSRPLAPAMRFKDIIFNYRELTDEVSRFAKALTRLGIERQARVAVLLPNCPEAIISALAVFAAGGIYVPVNPLLRPRQILHVLRDCDATILVTTCYLFDSLTIRQHIPEGLDAVIITDEMETELRAHTHCGLFSWSEVTTQKEDRLSEHGGPTSGSDPAMIFYTSGSTGRAKGVLVSHLNLVDGARIVSGYLGNTGQDRILATLPISFDYGFSQATTTLYVGAELILTNYSLPQQLLTEVSLNNVSGLAGVPTMWAQLASCKWSKNAIKNLRYITNSGGRMPRSVLAALREQLPDTKIFLMYGLTEAFRSTYLDPMLIDERPDSIGRPIPEVSLYVVNQNGDICKANEAGELVHSGALVTQGYWNDPNATAEQFRELPVPVRNTNPTEVAVWTGDIVRQDEDGYLYFVERADHMLKCSGYRISPAEIEEVIYESGLVKHVIAVGLPAKFLGQRIGLVIVPKSTHDDNDFAIRHVCARELPSYMQPDEVLTLKTLPLTANGKPDRLATRKMFEHRFGLVTVEK